MDMPILTKLRERVVNTVLIALIGIVAPALVASGGAGAADGSNDFVYVDLATYFNNDGIAYQEDTLDGDFDFTWTTLPAEELPESHEIIPVGKASYRFPDKSDGAKNNMLCFGQLIPVEQGQYAEVYLLATATAGLQKEKIVFRYSDGSEENATIEVRNFGPAGGQGRFGALATTHRHGTEGDKTPGAKVWSIVVPANAQKMLVEIQFPDNPSLRIFALTLRRHSSSG